MMRNYLYSNRLEAKHHRLNLRRGFSLAELVVSIGILVLMLSLAGQVFDTTIKSTGQATALTEVGQLLRAFEQTIREDLAHVQPGQSMILIQGNPVNAYWTPEQKAADEVSGDPATGFPHGNDPTREDGTGNMVPARADILMFFTARKGASYVHTNPPVTATLQQVVYGHAILGEYLPGGAAGSPPYQFASNQPAGLEMFPLSAVAGYPSSTKVSPVPASSWHLARRSVLLVPAAPPTSANPPWAEAVTDAQGALMPNALDDPRIIRGETDVIGSFNYEKWVLEPEPGWPWCQPEVFPVEVFGDEGPFKRSKLDPTPPALYANRLGHYFLPNCASFKVEWTLDPRGDFVASRLDGEREVYWFDPGDPGDPMASLQTAIDANPVNPPQNLVSLLLGRTTHPDGGLYSLADRFRGPNLQNDMGIDPLPDWLVLASGSRPAADQRPNMAFFGANRWADDPSDFVTEDIFPGALRITIDLYDRERRLDRPIRHVMIVPVGG